MLFNCSFIEKSEIKIKADSTGTITVKLLFEIIKKEITVNNSYKQPPITIQ